MSVPAEDGDGPWVPGFPDELLERWKAGEALPHHEKWNEAIQLGLEHKTGRWQPGDSGVFVLDFQVRVSKRNPGWIDGYRVVARP